MSAKEIIMPKSIQKTVRFKSVSVINSDGADLFLCLDEEGQLWVGDLSNSVIGWSKANMPIVGQQQQPEQLDVQTE